VSVGKWIWGICVLVAIAAVLWRSRADILRMLDQVPLWMLAGSFLCTVAAKFLLGDNARIAARRSGIELDYATAARLYNMSQLGKYIPGSIWQFVGRAAAYRNLGAGYGAIRDSLMTESLWVVAGAAITGLVLSGHAIVGILEHGVGPVVRWWFAGGFLLVAVVMVVLLLLKRTALLRYLRSAIPPPRALLVQAGIWLLLGTAFWVLAHACGMPAEFGFSIGLFATAYAVGFLVPIAPAGLGVRDAVLTLGLMPYASTGEALAVTAVSRLIYLVVELLLVGIQEPLFRKLAPRAPAASPPP
jgi:uncharacterized membrane protein YbhN (UPF0104 family)